MNEQKRALIWLSLCWCGCKEPVSTKDTTTSGLSPLPVEEEEEDPPIPPPSVEVILMDSASQPLVGWQVTLFAGAIERGGETDDQGKLLFEDLPAGLCWVQSSVPDGSGLATPLASVLLGDSGQWQLPMYVQPLDPASVLPETPALLTMGEGLEVLAAAGDVLPDVFQPQPDSIAGVRIPDGQFPRIYSNYLFRGGWFLGPFGATAPGGLPIQVAGTLGLPEGARLRVHEIQRDAPYSLVDIGELEVSGGEIVGDVRLTNLTAVFITDYSTIE